MYKKENIKQDFWKIFFPLLLIFYIFIAYNLVDVYFAGFVSDKAIAGLQVAYPMFFFILALNEWLSTAINNLASISLWENKKENISKYLTVWGILSIFLWIIFFIFAKDIVNIFLAFSGSLDEEVKNYAISYGTVLFKYSFFYIFWWMFWQLFIVFKKRKAQIFLALMILFANVILDYLFVKYLNLWVSWIAYATVITWVFTVSFWLFYIIFKEKISHFTKKIKLENFKKFLSFAFSASFVMSLTMLTIMVDNYFFAKIWTESLASYSIWTKLKDFVFYPMVSFSIAFSVLYWYFYWKKDYETLKKLLAWVLKLWLIYGLSLFIILPLIWKIFWKVFSQNQLVIDYLSTFMLFAPVFLIWYVFRYIYSTILQITSYHKIRIFLNILFLIFVFVFEYIFYNLYHSYTWIWVGAVIASLLVSFLTYLFYKMKVEKEI